MDDTDVDFWSRFEPADDAVEDALVPPVDAELRAMTRAERFRERRLFNGLRSADDLRKQRRSRDRAPAPPPVCSTARARENANFDHQLRRYAVLLETGADEWIEAKVLKDLTVEQLREPDNRHCSIHDAPMEREGLVWRCTQQRKPYETATFGAECQRRAKKNISHLRWFRFDGACVQRDNDRDLGGTRDFTRCECGSAYWVEAPWYDSPCDECGAFVPCPHPPGDAESRGSRGSKAKPRVGLACASCSRALTCDVSVPRAAELVPGVPDKPDRCGGPIHVAKTERLHCSTCEAAFTTGSSAPSSWRCPGCGGSERSFYQDGGELQQAGSWHCAECEEDSYVTAKPSKKPGRQPALPADGAAQWGRDDRLAALAPVGLALALIDPVDAAAWALSAVRGMDYEDIAALAVEKTAASAAREPRPIVSWRHDGRLRPDGSRGRFAIARIATTRGPFRLRCHGCGSMNRTAVGTCAVCLRPEPRAPSLPRSYGSVGRAVQRAREAIAENLDFPRGGGIRFRRPALVPGARPGHALVGGESISPENHQYKVKGSARATLIPRVRHSGKAPSVLSRSRRGGRH